jgi:hypothetical protein
VPGKTPGVNPRDVSKPERGAAVPKCGLDAARPRSLAWTKPAAQASPPAVARIHLKHADLERGARKEAFRGGCRRCDRRLSRQLHFPQQSAFAEGGYRQDRGRQTGSIALAQAREEPLENGCHFVDACRAVNGRLICECAFHTASVRDDREKHCAAAHNGRFSGNPLRCGKALSHGRADVCTVAVKSIAFKGVVPGAGVEPACLSAWPFKGHVYNQFHHPGKLNAPSATDVLASISRGLRMAIGTGQTQITRARPFCRSGSRWGRCQANATHRPGRNPSSRVRRSARRSQASLGTMPA